MAKKRDRKVDLEADDVAEEVLDDEAVAEAEVEEAGETDAEVEEVAADVDDDLDDADDADEDDGDDDDGYEEEPAGPKPKNTALTVVLCVLNMVAALGFVFMLMLNYEKRQAYTHAAMLAEFQNVGVGIAEDRGSGSPALSVQANPKLGHDVLSAAAKERGGTVRSKEEFTPFEDRIRYQLYVNELPPEILKELMRDLGDPVGSIEAEFKRLESKLFNDLQEVVKAMAALAQKDDAATKQKRIAGLLYPLCITTTQVEKLEKKIKAAQGELLDTLLAEAVERRILANILLPIEMFRPGDVEQPLMEKVADLDTVSLDQVRDLMRRRLKAAGESKFDGAVHHGKEWDGKDRGTMDKRQTAAFLLVSLALAPNQLNKHLDKAAKIEDKFLDPKGLERAQRLCGLLDFTAACKAYNEALHKLEQRTLEAIVLDREGFALFAKNEAKRSQGFADKHAELVFRIRQAQFEKRLCEERIKGLTEQRDLAGKQVEVRTAEKAALEKRVIEERTITAKRTAELRERQQQLFDALKELAVAGEINADLENKIRRLSGVKGGQP